MFLVKPGKILAWDIRVKKGEHTAKDFTVTITESHLVTIPERIIHSWWAWDVIEVNTGNEGKTSIVNGVSSKDFGIKVKGVAKVLKNLLCVDIISNGCSVISLLEDQSLALLV